MSRKARTLERFSLEPKTLYSPSSVLELSVQLPLILKVSFGDGVTMINIGLGWLMSPRMESIDQ